MFIGSSVEGLGVAKAIRSNLWRDVEITTWPHVFNPTKSTLEDLVQAVNRFDFGVFIFSRDDASTIRANLMPVVRDNVILEAGMFIGRLGRERVFIITPHDDEILHLPTDLLGTTTLEYDAQRRDEELEDATGPACDKIAKIVKGLGGIRASEGVVAYGDTVVLSIFDGSYVQVGADPRGTLTATSKQFNDWDRFEVVSATGAMKGRSVRFGDKIALKATKNHLYVGVDYNDVNGKGVAAWIPNLDRWETFVLHSANPSRAAGDVMTYGTSFALFSDENKSVESCYVAYKPAPDTQTFWAAASSVGNWERLMFVEPERR